MMNAFASAHNVTAPGGACATVGVVGGYLQVWASFTTAYLLTTQFNQGGGHR